jgi:5-methylcytosine-specific restriction endonuclease McrA
MTRPKPGSEVATMFANLAQSARMSPRQIAKAAGATTYFSGSTCPKGHTVARFTCNGNCTACVTAYQQTEKRKGQISARYASMRDELRRYASRRYYAKRQLLSKQAKAWQARNPDRVREYHRVSRNNRRAVVGRHSSADIASLLRIQRGNCAGCSAGLAGKFHVDHIIPIARGGTSWCGNLQLLCASCNLTKSSLLPILWRARRLAREES